MARIGTPDRWWYEEETDPLALPVPEPSEAPAAPEPVPEPAR